MGKHNDVSLCCLQLIGSLALAIKTHRLRRRIEERRVYLTQLREVMNRRWEKPLSKRLPSADPQNRPNQERYLRVLASAYPDHSVCSITLLEGVRTSCRTGARWRVFCQAAVLNHQNTGLLLDVEGDHIWYGGVTVEDLRALANKSWSPHVGVPNQWDALDIPQQEMEKIVGDALDALAHHRVITYPLPISVEQEGVTRRVRPVTSPHYGSFSPDQCSVLPQE